MKATYRSPFSSIRARIVSVPAGQPLRRLALASKQKTGYFKTAVLRRGFALVVTLTMMVLLSIIAMGLLSLSAITLRTSGQDAAQMQARANARMALMIAIGELQKQMGPDQRISANSSILSESTVPNAHWLGAWNSWKAGLGESSQHSTIVDVSDEMAPTYQPNREDYFRSWLVSLHPDEASAITTPSALSLTGERFPSTNAEAVELVGAGSLGDAVTPSDIVNARLIDVADDSTQVTTGRYGWWIGDESQKARILSDSYEAQTALTEAEKIFRSQAPASTGTRMVPGLEDLENDSQLTALPSRSTLDLVQGVAGRPAQRNFHSITPFSRSVIADVREGGLKRDLSTLLERPIDIAETSDDFMLYRFDDAGEQRVPIQDLAAYYQLYYNDPNWTEGRRGGVEFNPSTKRFQIRVPDYGTPDDREKYLRQHASIYTSPVPIRIQYILALGAIPITPEERALHPSMRITDTHRLLLGVIPIVSLWNPTNLPMVLEQGNMLRFSSNTPPFGIKLKKHRSGATDGDVTDRKEYNTNYFNLNFAMTDGPAGEKGMVDGAAPYTVRFRFGESNSITFEPGEVKIFSYPIESENTLASGNDTTFKPAYGVYEPVNA